MIYILTGDIRSGKTTALLEWTARRSDVDGLLCPDGKNGLRFFQKVGAKDKFSLEVERELADDETIIIGSFRFLKAAFAEANNYLKCISQESRSQYLIIDELGKLELKNQGLHAAADCLIPKFESETKRHLFLVVRSYLLDEVIQHFGIRECTVIDKEDLAEDRFTQRIVNGHQS